MTNSLYNANQALYTPISYKSLLAKDKESILLFKDSITKTRMVVINEIPGLEEMRKNHMTVSLGLLNVSPSSDDGFSNGIKVFSNLISFSAPIFRKETNNAFSELGLDTNEYPNYRPIDTWPKISGFKESSTKIANFELEVSKSLFSLIEGFGDEKTNGKTKQSVLYNLENAETFSTRTVVIKPCELNEDTSSYSMGWHYDKSLISIHFRDFYYKMNDSGKYEEVCNPRSGGLIIRDSEGNDFRVELKENEMMLQVGIALQVFSGGEYQAQAHCLLKPNVPGVGRISNIAFINPCLTMPIMPFKPITTDVKKLLETHPNDRSVIKSSIKFTNHWYEDVPWITFSQNQLLQFNFLTRLASLGYDCNLSLKRWRMKDNSVIDFHFDKIDSTHTLGLELKHVFFGEKSLVIFAADEQSGGIGQGSNTWTSPKGNLYLTCIFKDKSLGSKKVLLPQLASLALKKTLEKHSSGEKFELKWINDLFYKDKKIAGILVSSTTVPTSTCETKFVVSVGVNLNAKTIETAICLKEITGKETNLDVFKKDFLDQFLFELNVLKSEVSKIIEELNRNLLYFEKNVDIWDEKLENVLVSGRFIGVNEFGNAIVVEHNKTEPTIVIEGRMRKQLAKEEINKDTTTNETAKRSYIIKFFFVSFLFAGGFLAYYFKKKSKR